MLKVIKIGGNVVDNPDKLTEFLSAFAGLNGPKILVHGGGKIATAISKALGIETTMIKGRRVTDAETIKVVTMVYAGLINKDIVNKLNARRCNAIGLCGADGKLILSQRRSPIPVDYGFVGDPQDVNSQLLASLIEQGFTPVIAPITTDGNGTLLNTNADTVAQTIATAMAKHMDTELVFCFEKKGVLSDVEDENSVISAIDKNDFERLKADGTISDGMLPKIENAFNAIAGGVKKVVICSSDCVGEPGYGGTSITA